MKEKIYEIITSIIILSTILYCIGLINITTNLSSLLEKQIEIQEKMNREIILTNEILERKLITKQVVRVTLTAYPPLPEHTDETPFITASNQKVRDGIVALSRDIEKDFNLKFGDKIIISGIGEFEFQDRMHSRWKRKVDIFMWEKEDCLKFGKKLGTIIIAKR